MKHIPSELDDAHKLLIKLVEQAPDDWAMRKKAALVLFDAGFFADASQVIWDAPEIPPEGAEYVFSARIVGKGQPTRAMRLMHTLIQQNKDNPSENIALAKLFVKANMPLQAIRLYGAAVAADASLAEEEFELSLLRADVEPVSWADTVRQENFPWDPPENPQEIELDDGHSEEDAALLSGLTQPVPIRAAMSEAKKIMADAEKKESPAPEKKAEPAKIEPPKPIEKAKEPKVEPVAKKPEKVKPAPEPQAKPVVKETPIPVKPVAEEKPQQAPPKAASVKVKTSPGLSAPKAAPSAKVDVPKSAEPAQGEETSTKLKSAAKIDTPAKLDSVSPELPKKKDQAIEETAEPLAKDTASAAKKDEKPEADADKEDLTDYVSGAMSEYESSVGKKKNQPDKKEGAFSSFMSRFRKNKPAKKEKKPKLALDRAREAAAKASAKEDDQSEPEKPAAVAKKVSAVKSVVERPGVKKVIQAKPSPLDNSGLHTMAQKPVAQNRIEPEKPKEIDGRTQLVALAPEDGTPFFDKVAKKYNSMQSGDEPKAVTVAREMADLDYLELINNAACNKDLNAFSTLLGLHRLMASNDCHDWGEDMNLLRKGYGDAVLATVVSKYSVSECREILNSVYQHPASVVAI